MRKATATYVAPIGDSKVVEMGGVTFFDGKPVELSSEDNNHMIDKLAGNPHFDVEVGEDDKQPVVKKKVGRPTNEAKAAEAAALKIEEDKKAAIAKIEADAAAAKAASEKKVEAKPPQPPTDAPQPR